MHRAKNEQGWDSRALWFRSVVPSPATAENRVRTQRGIAHGFLNAKHRSLNSHLPPAPSTNPPRPHAPTGPAPPRRCPQAPPTSPSSAPASVSPLRVSFLPDWLVSRRRPLLSGPLIPAGSGVPPPHRGLTASQPQSRAPEHRPASGSTVVPPQRASAWWPLHSPQRFTDPHRVGPAGRSSGRGPCCVLAGGHPDGCTVALTCFSRAG